MFRFRRFRTRLLALVLGLLAATLLLTYVLVSRANRTNAIAHIEDRLKGALRVFFHSVETRKQALADSAKVVSADSSTKTLYLQDQLDRGTLASLLASYADRLNVSVTVAFAPDGEMLAVHGPDLAAEHCGPFRHLITTADDEALEQNSDFAYLRGRLHVLTVVPIYAPRPNVIGWLGVAFPIDNDFTRALRETTEAEISFTSGVGDDAKRVLATTLTPEMAQMVADHGPEELKPEGQVVVSTLSGEDYVTLYAPLELLADDPARITLQRSLAVELAPARKLARTILGISLILLLVAAISAVAAARGVSQPLQQLAEHTKVVAGGDYTRRIELAQEDEIGQLATAFNHMTAGLAERDRVRDLLGKVVSPEIAAQLLQSDLKLGGEEREVTVLFSDLRDFTSLSEKLPATEVLALLNRYLDRMSTIIEQHGGVIDKYIGDAIMALFGAPVAIADAPERAIAAAREMAAALETLNRELAAEGKPPLAFGVGINTARVVAGNMGSKTRLNYTVIGDGVNLASRLEGLTKEPAYGTAIIISEATLLALKTRPPVRELGEVKVKGKAQAVKIYALPAKGGSQPPYTVA